MTRSGSNARQKPTRRQQMLHAAAYAIETLEAAAAGGTADPERLRLAADGLAAAARRLDEPKPRRQPSTALPRRGRLTGAGRMSALEQLVAMNQATALLTTFTRPELETPPPGQGAAT